MNSKDFLFPQSRFEVLRTLHKSPSAVSVREISYRSKVVLHSVQRALAFLTEKKVVSKKTDKQRVYYYLSNSEVSEFVSSLIKALEPFEIKARADALQDRSLELLNKIDERTQMIKHAKETFKQ